MDPLPKMIGFIGFHPQHNDEVKGEIWEYQTEQSEVDKDGRFTVSVKLNKPLRLIDSNHNSHP